MATNIYHRGGNGPNARHAFDLSDGEGRAEIIRAGYWTLTRADGHQLVYPLGLKFDHALVEEGGFRYWTTGLVHGKQGFIAWSEPGSAPVAAPVDVDLINAMFDRLNP